MTLHTITLVLFRLLLGQNRHFDIMLYFFLSIFATKAIFNHEHRHKHSATARTKHW